MTTVSACVVCGKPARVDGGVCSTRCLAQFAHQRSTGCTVWPCEGDHGGTR